ncbi:hypothetical protein [Magnetospirillum sp. 15-1]|uniref:hypothetical protein n=1 Tax=Magnetospirillum sp. 15-1 TaxID=1979370 RepID=UPI0011419450|nr:hypothetical protein [Magnetospirillum sp. 15-1]
MPFYPVRKDFAFDVQCHAKCGHTLKSNVATILCDEHGTEYPFGPTCARNHLDEDGAAQLRRIPDFTKAAPGQDREGGKRVDGEHSGGGVRDDEAAKFKRIVTYMLLRQERLAHIPGAQLDVLGQYHAAYLEEGALSDDAVRHIGNIEKKTAGGRYGYNNLQTVYAFDRCIERAIRGIPEDRRSFVGDILRYLRDNLYLTQKQIDGLDKWLKRIDGYLPLDPSGFWKR